MKFLHTRFRVSDMKRSVDFYTNVLGLSVARSTKSPRGYLLVFLKGNDEAEIELVQLPGKFVVPQDMMHVAFGVESLEPFKKYMTDEPIKTSSGNFITFLSDPDGYEIELISKS